MEQRTSASYLKAVHRYLNQKMTDRKINQCLIHEKLFLKELKINDSLLYHHRPPVRNEYDSSVRSGIRQNPDGQ